jgi:hypothetical protein
MKAVHIGRKTVGIARLDDQMAGLADRIKAWREPFALPAFVPNPPTPLPPSAFDPTSVEPVRLLEGRGISRGERYQKQAKLLDLYSKLIPEDKQLSRYLANLEEDEVFKNSTSQPFYVDNFICRFKTLSTQIELLRALS